MKEIVCHVRRMSFVDLIPKVGIDYKADFLFFTFEKLLGWPAVIIYEMQVLLQNTCMHRHTDRGMQTKCSKCSIFWWKRFGSILVLVEALASLSKRKIFIFSSNSTFVTWVMKFSNRLQNVWKNPWCFSQ